MFHYQKGFRLYQSLFVIVVMEVFIIIVKLNNGEEPVLKSLYKNWNLNPDKFSLFVKVTF